MANGIWKLAGLGLLGLSAVPAITRQARKISFEGKVVLITGGSRGLGLELARVLGAQGASLALIARDGDELERAKELLAPISDKVFTFVCDITQKQSVIETVAAVQQRCGAIDVLINDAGVIECGPMEVQTIEDYEKSMNTHFWGPLYMSEAALDGMRRRKFGRIVNIASIAGLVSVPHLLPYSASKHALVGFSQGLRTELLKDNIYVTTVCPGLMRTGSPMNAEMKGHHRMEYALFSLLDSLPFTSIEAEKAAQQIVRACKYGDANLVISIQAQMVQAIHSLAPGLTEDVFGITNFFLPGKGGIGTDTATGRDSESFVAPSILTKLSDNAAKRNNEVV